MLRYAALAGMVLGTSLLAGTHELHAREPQTNRVVADTGHIANRPVMVAANTPTADGSQVTPAMVDAGRGIFHGQGGCYACHGTDMQGSAVAPPLNKQGKPWVVATGGAYNAIVRIVTHGVPGTLMISHPNGISDAQVAEVAAYIWAVNHSGAKP